MKFIKVIMLVFFIFYSSTLAISGEQVDLGQRKLLNAVQLGNIEVIKNAIGSGINLLTKNTLLFFASNFNQREIVKLLLEAEADVNAPYKEGVTSLYIASELGHTEIVKLLLEAKADVNATDKNGASMLFMASANNHTEIVKLLLDAKADVNAAYNGMTPLFIASGKGYLEIVKLLLKAKADVNVTDNVGATSLYVASQNGHAEVVELLLSAGADVNAKAKVGGRYYSPLDVAEHNKNEQVIKLLIEYKTENKINY